MKQRDKTTSKGSVLTKSLAERLAGPESQVDVQVFLNEAKRATSSSPVSTSLWTGTCMRTCGATTSPG